MFPNENPKVVQLFNYFKWMLVITLDIKDDNSMTLQSMKLNYDVNITS